MERYDACVIGGGPAGSTVALLLAKAGWSVLLAERREFPRRKVCGEYLSPSNWPLLEALDIADAFADLAGPQIVQTALFAGETSVTAPLPRFEGSGPAWGRALSRECLDSLLADAAVRHGVDLRQPARCVQVTQCGGLFCCHLELGRDARAREAYAPIVVGAHGSWDLGPLSTQRQRHVARMRDWLAFKAHLRETGLAGGLMPLLCFADGYGGMVECDGGRTSFSCCIRRARFDRLARHAGSGAGPAVLGHVLESCPVLRPVLETAALAGPWLAAGPIQPGLRQPYRSGVFLVGNAAGEAHPVVAEGISMAMQSAWLLAQLLIPQRDELQGSALRDQVGRAYAKAWRRNFAPRIRAAAAIAQLASRPRIGSLAMPLLRSFPAALTWGARLAGKAKLVVTREPLLAG